MRYFRAVTVCFTLFVCALVLSAQQKESAESGKPAEKGAQPPRNPANFPPILRSLQRLKEEPPIVTHHEIHVGGRVLRYTATTGYMPIRNEEGTEVEANIFFVAYTLDNARRETSADVLV